jgi:ribosome recycling factor
MSVTLVIDLKKRMEGAIGALNHDLKGLRTGRASANLLDSIRVDAYGDIMQLSQLATVNVPEARLMTVQVWDKAMVKAVEKGINIADLGLSPVVEGQLIRIAIPPLSEERRADLVKVGHKYAEQGKVAIRNIRRDGMDQVKKMEKDNLLSQDASRQLSDEVQKVTDDFIKQIEQLIVAKEKEITQI